MTCTVYPGLSLENTILVNFIGKRVDGVVVVPSLAPRTEHSCYEKLAKHRIPFVFSMTLYPGVKVDCVMTDLEEVSYELTRYLKDLGHRRIVFLVSGWTDVPVSSLRIRGYMRAFRESGIRFENDWILPCRHTDFVNGYETTLTFPKDHTPDADIAINDITALGAKRAVKELGYRIPKYISLAGYDDMIFSSIPEIPRTTVKQDISGIAAETVNCSEDGYAGGEEGNTS